MENMILSPVITLVFLTLGMGVWLGRLRFLAVKKKDLNPRYYELNRGGKLPDYLAKVSNNYDNLLALPILFYLVSILMLITSKIEISQIILAWLFVASRYLHSYIHTTYNNVRHRMVTFMFGVISLIGMWALFFVRIMQS